LVASKAILGEWIGGSGGGWQDSGGVWPGMKLIKGVSLTTMLVLCNFKPQSGALFVETE